MTREAALMLASIIKAYGEGKTIQYSRYHHLPWTNTSNPNFDPNYDWRIKPESEYVPFTYEDNLVGRIVRLKDQEEKYLILKQNKRGIAVNVGTYLYDKLLEFFIFDDGTNCGKKVE
jgi:hypothetical protein